MKIRAGYLLTHEVTDGLRDIPPSNFTPLTPEARKPNRISAVRFSFQVSYVSPKMKAPLGFKHAEFAKLALHTHVGRCLRVLVQHPSSAHRDSLVTQPIGTRGAI